MKTETERLIRHRRKRSGILVPLLEDLFQFPVEIEDKADVEFINTLLLKAVVREKRRNDLRLFSPSQLSHCLRYVYLLRHHEDLGIGMEDKPKTEANYYFFNGNWVHFKWQFALHKLERRINDPGVFKIIGVEVPIISKRKDHGGTVDALVLVNEEPHLVDFKGLNVRTFQQITEGDVPVQYAVQLTDYGMLFNSQRTNTLRVQSGLLVVENKGGPSNKHLISLHETAVPISTYLPEVHLRLKILREHENFATIPRPECQSTQEIQFTACPFRNYCKHEVIAIQRRLDSQDTAGYEVATPGGNGFDRARRNSKRR